MRTIGLLCIGVVALLAMEIAYSLQIQRYETPESFQATHRVAFFCGPITATLKSILFPSATTSSRPRSI